LLVGLAVCAVALTSWRVPPGDGAVGADVAFFVVAGDGLSVSPDDVLTSRRAMAPGGADVRARMTVRNPRATAVRVRLRAPADPPGLDRMLRVEATAGRTRLFRGQAGGLRRWTRNSFHLAPRQAREVTLRAWLPAAAGGRHRGRIATLAVEFRPLPAEDEAS
jgi:hypothetical protein